MYRLNANFNLCDDEKQPYCLQTLNNSKFTHHFGCAEDGVYALLCDKGINFFRMPNVGDVSLTYKMSFSNPMFYQTGWANLFGFDLATRQGYRIMVEQYNTSDVVYRGRKLSDLMDFILEKVDGEVITEIERFTFDGVNLEGDVWYDFKLEVKGNSCYVEFAGYSHTFEVQSTSGVVGFLKVMGENQHFIKDCVIESPESPQKTTILNKTFEIPKYDGNKYGSAIHLLIEKYENDVCEITSEYSGGVGRKTYEEYTNSWACEYDLFINPYIRLIGDCESKKMILKPGRTYFIENFTERSKQLKVRMKGEDPPNESNPFVTNFYTTDFESWDCFVFGYERYKTFFDALEADTSEYVFDMNGELLYYGRPLDEEMTINVESPDDKKLVKIYEDGSFLHKDELIENAKNNHFFMAEEKPSFKIKMFHKLDDRLVKYRVCLTDAFFDEIKELEPLNIEETVTKFGHKCITMDIELENLPQSVYHLSITAFYGSREIKRHYSAFEVIDKGLDVSPQHSAGLPLIYVGDGKTQGPHPWKAKPDSNIHHYIDTIQIAPIGASALRAWEAIRLFNKKLMVWYNSRTLPADLSYEEYPELISNTDYLLYNYPGNVLRVEYGTTMSGGIYNYDIIRELYNEFASEHPDYNLITYDKGERFGDEHANALAPYFSEWRNYANKKYIKLFKPQWDEIKKLNPDIKRFAYGPYSKYNQSMTGGELMRWFGFEPEDIVKVFEGGFMQFEDYPFVCDYPTAESAWNVATIKLLANDLRLAPEMYGSFEANCPDGAVYFAYPPLGGSYSAPYQTITQMYEYLYNGLYYSKNGFKYWTDNSFMMYALHDITEGSDKFYEFVSAWGKYLKNKPQRPLKTISYLFKLDDSDDVFQTEKARHLHTTHTNYYYNKSASAMMCLYVKASVSGLPNGFVCDTLDGLDENQVSMLVIPSVKGLSNEDIVKIRELYKSGVKLIAVSDITGLEDLFGVRPNPRRARVSKVFAKNKSEVVATVDTEFSYEPTTARSVITTDAEDCTFVYENNGCVLIDSSLFEIGIATLVVGKPGARHNISKLINEELVSLIEELSEPIIKTDSACGVSMHITEKGDTIIKLTDYSKYKDYTDKQVTVWLKDKCYTSVENVGCGNPDISPLYDGESLVGFMLTIRSKETLILKIK